MSGHAPISAHKVRHIIYAHAQWRSLNMHARLDSKARDQGLELQCLLRVKEDLSYVLIFQGAKNNV